MDKKPYLQEIWINSTLFWAMKCMLEMSVVLLRYVTWYQSCSLTYPLANLRHLIFVLSANKFEQCNVAILPKQLKRAMVCKMSLEHSLIVCLISNIWNYITYPTTQNSTLCNISNRKEPFLLCSDFLPKLSHSRLCYGWSSGSSYSNKYSTWAIIESHCLCYVSPAQPDSLPNLISTFRDCVIEVDVIRD